MFYKPMPFLQLKKTYKHKYNHIALLHKIWFVLCDPVSTLLKTVFFKKWGDFINILMSLYGNRVAEWQTEFLGTQETVYWSPKIIFSQLTSGA